ncbi:MAG: hypothetical protein IJR52_06740, partial [Selenomonadaceae bacterium]|nr:hypothetical protein [Selenomonadaceae bacterium]
ALLSISCICFANATFIKNPPKIFSRIISEPADFYKKFSAPRSLTAKRFCITLEKISGARKNFGREEKISGARKNFGRVKKFRA